MKTEITSQQGWNSRGTGCTYECYRRCLPRSATMVAKLSSARTIPATPLVTSVPVIPIPIRQYQRVDGRSVVNAVTRHSCNHALFCASIGHVNLVLRLNACINAKSPNMLLKLFIRIQCCAPVQPESDQYNTQLTQQQRITGRP